MMFGSDDSCPFQKGPFVSFCFGDKKFVHFRWGYTLFQTPRAPVLLKVPRMNRYRFLCVFVVWNLPQANHPPEAGTMVISRKNTKTSGSVHTPSEKNLVVVSNIFYFHPYLGKISNLTNIFQMGWNHQLEKLETFRVLGLRI